MALSLMLRNSARTQVLPKILPTNFLNINVRNTRVFSQLTNNVNKNSLVASVCKNQLQVAEVQKRNMSADHSKLWPIEKAVSVVLLGLVPATFLFPNVITDDLFAVTTVLHAHWGFEACCVDYIRPIILGSVIPKLALGLLYVVSALTLGGLIYYNHNSVGIGKTVRRIWELKPIPEEQQ